jgi:hypothetical protein
VGETDRTGAKETFADFPVSAHTCLIWFRDYWK